MEPEYVTFGSHNAGNFRRHGPWYQLIVTGDAARTSSPSPTDCPHRRSSSPFAFISRVEECANDIHRGCSLKRDLFSAEASKYETVDLLAKGLCRRCVLFIASNLPLLLSRVFVDALHPNTLCTLYYMDCLRHHHTANFVLNQSTLWLGLLSNITRFVRVFEAGDRRIATRSKAIRSRAAEGATTFYEECNTLTNYLCLAIRSLSSWRRKHWAAVFESHFWRWLAFIANQLERRSWIESFDSGVTTILCFYIVAVHALYEMAKFPLSGYSKKFKVWIRRLKSIKKRQRTDANDRSGVLDLFLMLRMRETVDTAHRAFAAMGAEVDVLKWQRMQCQNGKCDRLRITHTLYKCKACRVARYCSSKCQKRDWATHKTLCRKMKRMARKEKTR